jgi:hypothetical protein
MTTRRRKCSIDKGVLNTRTVKLSGALGSIVTSQLFGQVKSSHNALIPMLMRINCCWHPACTENAEFDDFTSP